MSPAEKLAAAADKIQAHLDVAATMPWRAAEQTHDEWVSIQNNYVAIGSMFSGSDAEFAALAVNAMPAVARILRIEAKTIERDPTYQSDSTIAALADQILGGKR